MQSGMPGQAMMPYKATKLLLPPGTKAEAVQISFSNPKEISGEYILYPKQYVRPISKGASGEFLFDENFYKSKNTVGEEKNYKVYTEYMNGHSVAFTHFTPLRYLPVQNKLYFFQTVKIEINAQNNEKSKEALKLYKSSPDIRKRIADYVDNSENLNLYSISNTPKTDSYEVLIISKNQYEANFEDIRKVYSQRGLKSQFHNLNDIYNSMTGVDNPEKIRNFIIQEYQTHQIKHVLLAGDAEVVPYRGFYCEVQSSQFITDDNIPSDIYYSALDGNWNTDGDELWGEIDEDDLLPEVSVARLPFSNNQELLNMLHKIKMYQENPIVTELNNPLLAGEYLYENPQTWGSDYLNLLVGNHSDNGYETTGIPENSPYKTLYAKEQEWGQAELLMEINSGHPFIHHSGHSSTDYTMFLFNYDITNNNFNYVNGADHNYPLVYTHGCICGDFSADDCIAEEMLKINNFAAGFIGNSRYGWFNEGQTEGPSTHIHREFMNALYAEKQNNIGTAHMRSKYETAQWVNAPNQHEEGAIRWCFYDCNVLSDPTLPIWTDTPTDIQVNYLKNIAPNIPYKISISSVDAPLSGVNCVVFQNDKIIGSAKTNENGIAQINIDAQTANPGAAKLIITGYNILKTVYDINVVNNPATFINISNYTINDYNNNGQVDNNESQTFNMTFENLGSQNTEDCRATIGTDDEYVMLPYCFANLGTIPAGGSVYSENELCLDVKNYVPDQHIVLLTVNTRCNQSLHEQNISMKINAPVLNIKLLSITETSGNSNGVFEPGETANFIFEVKNTGHSSSPECNASLINTDGKINIIDNTVDIGFVEAQSQKEVIFSVTASENMQIGENYDIEFDLEAGEYSKELQYNLIMNNVVEDFETNDFSSFNWQFNGSAQWTITQDESNTGTYSAVSGDIGMGETSALSIDISSARNDEVSFYKKVSSEEYVDFLNFYIDDVLKGQWSGDIAWTKETFPITAGQHNLKWVYSKDFLGQEESEDKAWIDDISFPLWGNTVSVHDIDEIKNAQINCYPNPFVSSINFSYNLKNNAKVMLEIFNTNGTKEIKIEEYQPAGQNKITCPKASQLPPGIYIWRLITDENVNTGKIIKTN